MARRGGRSNEARSARGSAISQNRSLTSLLSPVPTVVSSPVLSSLDDGRFWHPDPEHGALTVGGKYASVTVHSRPVLARSQALSRWGIGGSGVPVGLQVPVGIKFQNAFNVLTCIRRKTRREVLFAKRKSGRGGSRGKYRRTWKSAIWC